jgi:hypothetical protein
LPDDQGGIDFYSRRIQKLKGRHYGNSRDLVKDHLSSSSLNGVAKDVPIEVIFKGVLPMLIALLLCNLIILFFPQIALFLPNLMR